MAHIEVVDSTKDKSRWLEWMAGMPSELQDIYYYPAYVNLHRPGTDSHALLYAYKETNHVWLNPILRRPIPYKASDAIPLIGYDIESAYGYGGPLSNSDSPLFLQRANNAFDEWCTSQNIVAEFVRFHPMLDNQRWRDNYVDVVSDRETTSLDLRHIKNGQIPISQNAMNMVNRAERSGLQVEACASELAFTKFKQLYAQTMKKIGADSFYYFDENYFQSLCSLTREYGWLIVASLAGKIIAAAVFLSGSKLMHYHLSASDRESGVPGATNAIIYQAAVEAHRCGLERLHLGGGTTRRPSDSLFKFKRRMATDTHSFFIGRRVHNVEIYRTLRANWERQFPNLIDLHGGKVLCYRFVVSN